MGRRVVPKTEKDYELRQTELWEATTIGLSSKTRRIVDDKVLNHIKPDPYSSEPLHFELEGLWSYHRMKTGNRIIFAVCEDCRERKLESVSNCADCREIPDNTIMLVAFGGHDIYERLKRKRKKSWKKTKQKARRAIRRQK